MTTSASRIISTTLRSTANGGVAAGAILVGPFCVFASSTRSAADLQCAGKQAMVHPGPDPSGSLDAAQVALLNAIVERLIPSDERTPGAREAQAARYIVRALASDYQRYLADYIAGLASIDARAQRLHGSPFVTLEATSQDAILAEFDGVERTQDGPTPRTFFDLVLKHTREGVFGDPRWGGNADRLGWALIGYSGPKFTWSAADQHIELRTAPDQP
jgi:gluconate 2-dehydrogenase gamma chain